MPFFIKRLRKVVTKPALLKHNKPAFFSDSVKQQYFNIFRKYAQRFFVHKDDFL